jgi:hypothetical protein
MKIKALAVILLSLSCIQFSKAQELPPPVLLETLEYYIDTDPGMGNGTQVVLNALEPSVSVENIEIDLSNLSFGFHKLVTRIKDKDGQWGIPKLLVFYVPEPRQKNNIEAAKQVFRSLYDNEGDIVEQVNLIVNSQKSTDDAESIFSKKYGIPLSLAFFIAFFNQFSGINAILYYANRIFAEAGLAEQAGALGSIGLGITNFVFTLLGMFLIDRLGRKQLLYIGSVGYIVSLSIVSLCFYNDWSGMIVPISLFAFIASHAIGQGAVIWVFISEIFPNHLRASGQSFGSSTHWVLAAIIPSMVPMLFSTIGAGVVFLIFTIMMVFQLLFVFYVMPEIKGVSLEELSKKLTRQ